MKCNNCGFTVQHCPNCGNEFPFVSNKMELPPMEEIVRCRSIKARLIAAFIGWGAQFENAPALLPDVRFADKNVYVDGRLFCSAYCRITGVNYETDSIDFVLEQIEDDEMVDYKATIEFEWPFNASPFISDIILENNPYRTF